MLDALKSEGIARAKRLVAERAPEGLYLEFKRKKDPHSTDVHKEDRRDLGEALSGFANAAGGTLLIGVGSESTDGQDYASQIFAISNLAVVASKYESLAREFIAPELSGVEVLALEEGGDAGIIAVHIPAGNSRPYMSLAPGHQKYFRRSHDRFIPMEHYEVEDMFRLRSAPNLQFVLEFASEGSIGSNPISSLNFGVENLSGVTAKYPFVAYDWRHGLPGVAKYGLDGNGYTLWPKSIAGSNSAVMFAAGVDKVVHPGQRLFVSKIEMRDFVTQNSPGHWSIGQLEDGEVIDLTFTSGCEDVPARKTTYRFSKSDLLARRIPVPVES